MLQGSNYVAVTIEDIHTTGLTGRELLAYCIVKSYCSRDRFYEGGAKHLSSWFNISEKACRDLLGKLCRKRFLKKYDGNRYRIAAEVQTPNVEVQTPDAEVQTRQREVQTFPSYISNKDSNKDSNKYCKGENLNYGIASVSVRATEKARSLRSTTVL